MNMEELKVDEIWNNIQIQSNNVNDCDDVHSEEHKDCLATKPVFTISIEAYCSFTFAHKRDQPRALLAFNGTFTSFNNQSQPTAFTDFAGMLPPALKEIATWLQTQVLLWLPADSDCETWINMKSVLPGLPTFDITTDVSTHNPFEFNLMRLLKSNVPQLQLVRSYHQFMLMMSALRLYNFWNQGELFTHCLYSNISDSLSSNSYVMLFGQYISLTAPFTKLFEIYSRSSLGIETSYDCSSLYQNLLVPSIAISSELWTAYANEITNLKSGIMTPSPAMPMSNVLSLRIFSISPQSSSNELFAQFNDFVHSLSVSERSTQLIGGAASKKIKIHLVKLKRQIVTEEVPNIQYQEYEEQKQHIHSSISNLSTTKTTTVAHHGKDNGSSEIVMEDDIRLQLQQQLLQFSLQPCPRKTVTKERTVVEIVASVVNEVYKSFDTLYLRKHDEKRLKMAIEMFLNRKDLMQQLGLPDKLGIFLTGAPGTGKTSCVYVIACALGLDIYYVNISDVETNDELQQIFDYVNKNCAQRGIIIFEEIDKQTPIVLKTYNHYNSNNNETQISSETNVSLLDSRQKKLSLDYFLNLLQGALTQDGTIVIATSNHLELLEPALIRDGRFDVKIDMRMCDHYQIQCIYRNFLKREIPKHVLERIAEDQYTPSNIISHLVNYMLQDFTDEEICAKFISAETPSPMSAHSLNSDDQLTIFKPNKLSITPEPGCSN